MARRVLQLTSCNGFYGAERVLIELALGLREAGWAPQVAAVIHPGGIGREIADAAREHDLPTFEIPCRGALDRSPVGAIARHVREHSIDIVHSHKYKTDLLLGWAHLPRGVRRVATCHNWISDSAKLRLYEWFDKRALRRFDAVAAVSQPVLDRLRRAGVAADRCVIVANGVAIDPPAPDAAERIRHELLLDDEARLVTLVGRLSAEKALDEFLKAFAQVARETQAHAVLVGDGPLREELAAQAASLGLRERVHFLGFRRDISDLLAASDCYVICSRTEGLPMVLLEAMAAGTPVVASPVGDIPKLIEDGRTGRLIGPPGHVRFDQLAPTMLEVLREAAPARQRAEAARVLFEAEYSRAAMCARYLKLYEPLLND